MPSFDAMGRPISHNSNKRFGQIIVLSKYSFGKSKRLRIVFLRRFIPIIPVKVRR